MISVLIPFFNEEENLPILTERLIKSLTSIKEDFEIIYINDGSLDNSAKALEPLPKHVKLVSHPRQMGKGRALLTGYNASKGDIIVFMDADLEDDPDELPRFIAKLKEGYDLVNGVRKGRKHSSVIKMYSSLANKFIRNYLKSPFTDINCGYKAMRREVLETVPLYGNSFRFLPLGAFYEGFKVTEIEVKHKNRIYGVSKFGTGKIFIGLLDTLTAYFLYRFSERPLHFFGISGLILFMLGTVILVYLAIERLIFNHLLYQRPLLFLGMLCVIVGVQIIATGFLGELFVYYQKKKA